MLLLASTGYLPDADNTYWYPFVDGIGYWNENMPTFSNNLNALSPYGDPGSELVEDYNLIGWSQDINNNGQLDILDDIGLYFLGLSSMPQLIIDNQNRMFLVYSSVTETFNNGFKNYRHIWERQSYDLGETWSNFEDLNNELIHIFDECVYPSCAANSDDYYYLVYQLDNEPGTAVWGNQQPYVTNKIEFKKNTKIEFTGTINKNDGLYDSDVSQNFPNPFHGSTEIDVILRTSFPLCLEVVDMMGQKVFDKILPDAGPGLTKLTVDGNMLTPGIYFYTVKAGDQSVTKKMIVE